ncbi:MAG: helix-turn-helix domain-containing protein [Coriobacteriales bacterium]|jgi:transcriptional regulator with XRE-family HTH domain
MAELFASRLSTLLQQRGISQEDLALMTGLTPAVICRYVNGDRTPRAIVVAKIAKALGVQPGDLTGTSADQEIDEAVQLISRNANNLSDDQREQLIHAVINR